MSKKTKIIVIVVALAVLIGGYAIYAAFFLRHVAIGELCASDATCSGECLGFGDLLPDYSHKEICTKRCEGPADCPAPTTCEEIDVISTDGKGVETNKKKYCLPGGGGGGGGAQGR